EAAPLHSAGAEAPLMLEPEAPPAHIGPTGPSPEPQGPALALLGSARDAPPMPHLAARLMPGGIPHSRAPMSEVTPQPQRGRLTLYKKLGALGGQDAGQRPSCTDTGAAGDHPGKNPPQLPSDWRNRLGFPSCVRVFLEAERGAPRAQIFCVAVGGTGDRP